MLLPLNLLVAEVAADDAKELGLELLPLVVLTTLAGAALGFIILLNNDSALFKFSDMMDYYRIFLDAMASGNLIYAFLSLCRVVY